MGKNQGKQERIEAEVMAILRGFRDLLHDSRTFRVLSNADHFHQINRLSRAHFSSTFEGQHEAVGLICYIVLEGSGPE